MPLPSEIPTSFVPHVTAPTRQMRTGLTGAFNFFAYFILVIVFALAIGVFFYGRILAGNQSAKDAELATAEAAIDSTMVQDFVRLRDRLVVGEKLLSGHVALSGFFTALEMLVPTTVRFVSLDLSVDDSGTIRIDGSGVAKNFNALAAASTVFAGDGRIKNAIFSDIKVNPTDGSVSFALSGSLDPKLTEFSPNAYTAIPLTTTITEPTTAPQATSTANTATTTSMKKKP